MENKEDVIEIADHLADYLDNMGYDKAMALKAMTLLIMGYFAQINDSREVLGENLANLFNECFEHIVAPSYASMV